MMMKKKKKKDWKEYMEAVDRNVPVNNERKLLEPICIVRVLNKQT